MARKSKNIEGIITESVFPNRSIVEVDGEFFPIKGGILGQRVVARKVRRRKLKLLEVLEASPWEELPGCPHVDCGGCIYDRMVYEKEVAYKEKLLHNLFEKEGLDFDFTLYPNPKHRAYRNKMEYTFGDQYKGSPLALGLHKKNRFYEIENTDHCQIVHEDFNKIRKATRDYFDGVEHYNRKRHVGILRHLSIRRTELGEILINLVTVKNHGLDMAGYVQVLKNLDLEAKIVGILHTYNDSLSDAIVPEEVHLLDGRDYCVENIHGLTFTIGAFSFFQTNTSSAKLLYQMAMDMVEDLEGKVVLDLYSGTGTITQIFAKSAKYALGIEIVEEAVEAAKENAKKNQRENVAFIAGDVLQEIDRLTIEPDIVVLDPPREGINPRAIHKIIDFEPKEFVYISCNPTTFTRDIKVFMERGYKVEKICGLDQFPRTAHVECIAMMSRK